MWSMDSHILVHLTSGPIRPDGIVILYSAKHHPLPTWREKALPVLEQFFGKSAVQRVSLASVYRGGYISEELQQIIDEVHGRSDCRWLNDESGKGHMSDEALFSVKHENTFVSAVDLVRGLTHSLKSLKRDFENPNSKFPPQVET